MSGPRTVSSASEILKDVGVEIQGVSFFRISAELREFDDEADIPAAATEIVPFHRLKMRHVGRELGVRLSTKLDLGTSEIVVDATINYQLLDDVEIPDPVQIEFANEVGIMALIPYVRQAIADISQRVLGDAIIMPIIPRGELWFVADQPQEN